MKLCEFELIDYEFAVCKLGSYNTIDFSKEFIFLSKTDNELSLVCKADDIPSGAICSETGWRALRVKGILDFSLIGIISQITAILAEKEISVFVISTYDTDYILIKAKNLEQALQALIDSHYQIR